MRQQIAVQRTSALEERRGSDGRADAERRMTRQQIDEIAETIYGLDLPVEARAHVTARFAQALAYREPDFDRARFVRACDPYMIGRFAALLALGDGTEPYEPPQGLDAA